MREHATAEVIDGPSERAFAEEMSACIKRRSAVLFAAAPGEALDRLWGQLAADNAPVTRGLARQDLAARLGSEPLQVFDLAERWRFLTGLPFVLAFWAVREGFKDDAVVEKVVAALRPGLAPDAIIVDHTTTQPKLTAERSTRLNPAAATG